MRHLGKVPVWITYTVAFIILTCIIYSPLFLDGRSLIWTVDGISQHLPMLTAFQKMLKGIGTQSLFGWSWNLGLGADQMTTFAYYVVGDPFNYLVALFPTTKIEFAYQFLILIRLYATGLAFLTFARIWHFSRLSLLIGSLTYTFTAFALHIGMHHPFFLLPLIFFPLLCWGIERVFRGKSWWPLAIVIAITVASNVYFAYVLALGSVIYTIWRYWQQYRQTKTYTRFWQLIYHLLSAVLVGVACAAVLVIPTVLAMLHSTRTGGQFANGLSLYPLSYYIALPNLVLNSDGMPFWVILGISSLTWLAILHSLRHFKQRWDLNSLLIILLVGLLLPAVAATFNVLSSPSNRWLLLSTLLFSVLTMRLIDDWKKLDSWDYRLFLGASVGLIIIIWVVNGFAFNVSARDLISYILLFVLITWFIGSSAMHLSRLTLIIGCFTLLCLNLINTGFGATMTSSGVANPQQLYRGSATSWINKYLDGAQKALPRNDNFYRTTLTPGFYARGAASGKKNISMLLGTHDIASYFSVQNRSISQFSQSIGNQEADPNSPLSTADGRTTTRNLLGVRYIFELADRYDPKNIPVGYHALKNNDGHVSIFKDQPVAGGLSNKTGTIVFVNDNFLPLVSTQNAQISAAKYQRLNAVDKEQAMIQAPITDKPITGVKQVQPQKIATTVPYTVKVRNVTDRPVNSSSRLSQKLVTTNKKIVNDNQTTNKDGLHQLVSDCQGHQLTYDLILDHPEKWQNKELYLEVSGMTMVKPTLNQFLQNNAANAVFANRPNTTLAKIQQFRQALHTDWQLSGYYLSASTAYRSNNFSQQSPTNLSNYSIRKRVILNLGYSSHLRRIVTVRFSQVPELKIHHVKLMAVGFKGRYQRQIKAIQKHGLKQQKVTNNTITGRTQAQTASVLTTSIPYSTGWHLTVDDKPTKTQVVNTGFVGAKIPAGQHKVKLQYHTPGLRLGAIISLIGLLLLLVSILWQSHAWLHNQSNQ